MMKRNYRVKSAAVIAFAGLFGGSAPAANVDLKPGKYALTITYEVQNQRQNESRSGTRCITPHDLDNPEKIFSDQVTVRPKQEESCSVKQFRNIGGKISYDAECSNRTVHVEGNVSATGFSMVRTVKPKASQGVSLKFTVRGTRTGDCVTAVNTGER
ncbi:MAG TPA: DUF3617 family protein [Candidatus Acidoferrales bacterium]|nr:DUF3617 family protein [Candidatus Acidoferrales bacterium]HEV2499663.1 DUF3617 family protein [Terriglobia bacterium]